MRPAPRRSRQGLMHPRVRTVLIRRRCSRSPLSLPPQSEFAGLRRSPRPSHHTVAPMTLEASPFPPLPLAEVQRDRMLQEDDRALARMEPRRAAPEHPVRRSALSCDPRATPSASRGSHPAGRVGNRRHAPGAAFVGLGFSGRRSPFPALRLGGGLPATTGRRLNRSPPAAVFHAGVEALERLNRLSEAAAARSQAQLRFPVHPGLAG